MMQLEKDIVRAGEDEVVLRGEGTLYAALCLGMLMFIMVPTSLCLFAMSLGEEDMVICNCLTCIGSLFFLWLSITFVQLGFTNKTTIQFNNPIGYITKKQSTMEPDLIPGGPWLFPKVVATQIPLPKTSPFVESSSGTYTYPVQVGPDVVQIHQKQFQKYKVQIPLEGGKVYTLWETEDHNTYVEIITRINKAIQDYAASTELSDTSKSTGYETF